MKSGFNQRTKARNKKLVHSLPCYTTIQSTLPHRDSEIRKVNAKYNAPFCKSPCTAPRTCCTCSMHDEASCIFYCIMQLVFIIHYIIITFHITQLHNFLSRGIAAALVLLLLGLDHFIDIIPPHDERCMKKLCTCVR